MKKILTFKQLNEQLNELQKDEANVVESVEPVLADVSDDRISNVWSHAIGGNQPAMDKMRKDIFDLMNRDKISFIEMETEIENN